jgi:hypothetical protein
MQVFAAFLHLRIHMDDFSPDPSAASAETSTASTDSTASAAVSEVTTPEAAQSAATPAESTPEWPEEISSLPGPEQRTNWQQLRERYQQTHSQLGELTSKVEAFAPIEQELTQLGGFEQIKQGYQLAQSLFAPVIDPATGEAQRDPQTGLPAYSAAPFVEQMAEQGPQTLLEIAYRGMNMPFGNETIGHVIMRDYLGLDPELLPTYQQIKSSNDAAQFLQNTGQVTAEQLALIPEPFHGAYKSLTPELRAEVDLMGDLARDQYLTERAELLETRSFREQQKAEIAQRQQAEATAWQRQIEQRGEQYISTARESALNEVREKLKADAAFFPDQADNDRIQTLIQIEAKNALEKDTTFMAQSQQIADLYRRAAQCEANNEKYAALQAKTAADNLAGKLSRAYKSEVAKSVGYWSQRFSQARKGMDAARAEANPRAEFTRNGGQANGVHTPPAQGPRPPGAGRFFISEDRKQQIADQMKAAQMGRQ